MNQTHEVEKQNLNDDPFSDPSVMETWIEMIEQEAANSNQNSNNSNVDVWSWEFLEEGEY